MKLKLTNQMGYCHTTTPPDGRLTPLTIGSGVSYEYESIRAGSHGINL